MTVTLDTRPQGGGSNNGQLGQVRLYGMAAYGATGGSAINITPYDSGNILGTVPPGKAGIKLVDGTLQNATSLRVGQVQGVGNNGAVSSNAPDNFIGGTASQGGLPSVNSDQAASAGKSLSPEHE